MTDNKTVISKQLEKKLTQEYGRLSFRDKLMLVYAVSEATQEIKANADYQIEGRELEKKELLGIIQGKDEVIAELKEQVEALANVNIKAQNIIGELKAQIEKMKCCANCNNTWNGMKLDICADCKNHNKWEIKE